MSPKISLNIVYVIMVIKVIKSKDVIFHTAASQEFKNKGQIFFYNAWILIYRFL